MATKVGSLGVRLDIVIRQGTTVGPFVVTLTDATGAPVDLTGCEVTGAIRHNRLDASVIKALTCSLVDAVNGKYQFGLSAVDSATLPCGEEITDDTSIHKYDVELKLADTTTIRPQYYGLVHVLAENTR